MLSFSLERRLSKQDIFALYCNEVYLGQRNVVGVRGVDQAARVYFGKDLKDLTLAEAATLAGMIQSPARYSPVRSPDETRMRRNTVLGTMVRDGHITLAQAAAAAQEPLSLANFDPARESSAPYFVDYANREGSRDSERQMQSSSPPSISIYKPSPNKRSGSSSRGWTRLTKRVAQLRRWRWLRSIRKRARFWRWSAAGTMRESQLNRATDAKRQPGSVFKPFVYAAASGERHLAAREVHRRAARVHLRPARRNIVRRISAAASRCATCRCATDSSTRSMLSLWMSPCRRDWRARQTSQAILACHALSRFRRWPSERPK